MVRQRNPNTLANRMGELTSAFLIHCHPHNMEYFYQTICGLFCIAHGCDACGILTRKRGEFASHFAMRYRLVRTRLYRLYLHREAGTHHKVVFWESCRHNQLSDYVSRTPEVHINKLSNFISSYFSTNTSVVKFTRRSVQ